MNKMKLSVFLLLLTVTIKTVAQEKQFFEIETESYYNWENLPEYSNKEGYKLPSNATNKDYAKQKASFAQNAMDFEMFARILRDWGMELWKRNPNDFWELGCSSCITKMPEIKEVYGKYKDKGFDVISACFVRDDHDNYLKNNRIKDQRNKIISIHEKVGANWPLILLNAKPGDKMHPIRSTYGLLGVPQLMLLDETGKLLHYNGDMFIKGGLEKLVKAHLEKKGKS